MVAADAIKTNQDICKPIYHLTGINGQNHRVSTKGHLIGNFITDDDMKWLTEIHLIDRQNAGKYDGYIGYDFLKKYSATVDIHDKVLELHPTSNSTSLSAQTKPAALEGVKVENKWENQSKRTNDKRVGFILPEHISPSKDIRLDDIFVLTCDVEEGENECSTCMTNAADLPDEWKPQNFSDTEIRAVNAFVEEIAETPLTKLNNDLQFADDDDESMKLLNLERNNLILPPHAREYLQYFPPEVDLLPTKNIRKAVIEPGMTREEFILANLPQNDSLPVAKQKITELVYKYPYQFYVEGDKLAMTDIIQHKIYLKPGAPIAHTRQFRLSEQMRRDVIAETTELERQNIIRKSTSPFNSPAFMVGKKGDTGEKTDQRFVVNYVKVNEHTELRDFPIPRIDQLVDGFTQCKIFSTMDIKSAFHQIELYEPHREITAFTAGFTKYEWNRMPMGLCGGPLTMQEAVTRLLGDLLDQGVSVYIDDVSIGAPTIEKHDELLGQVLERLQKHNFQIKIPKCHFYIEQFEFLGFIVCNGHIKPNPNKISAIMRIVEPKNRKKLQSFMGMLNYYRKFVRNFSELARPLNKLTSIKVPFVFDEKCRHAFNELRNELARDVLLRIPIFGERFYISTDASNSTIGAVLAQGKPPNDCPIQFFSKALSDPQTRWTTREKECLALVSAVREFSPYLQGREFTLITDNLALVYMNNHNDAYSKLFRMKMELMSYKYTIVYRPGIQNRVADALTRLDYEEELNLAEFLEKYGDELDTKTIRAVTRSGLNTIGEPKNSTVTKPFINNQPGLAKEDDEYDRIFSIISTTNSELIQKLTAASEFDETIGWVNLSDTHSMITLKLTDMENELKSAIEEIAQRCRDDPEILAIAINTDLRAKYLFILRWLLDERLQDTNIHITIHTDQIMPLTDPRQIQNALEMHHKTRLGGHCGIERMKNTMKRIYSWPTMIKDIKQYVAACPVCEKTKMGRHTRAPLQITSVGEKAFDHVFIDYMGPVIASEAGHTFIFVATCDLTKYSIAVPTMGHTAAITADCFMKEIILKFGFPAMVTSDRGAEFLSDLFKELNRKLEIKQISTTPYHPSSNIVERQNRNLNQYLRAYVDQKPQIWASLLPYATFAYNITVHSRTGFSPFQLLYGREITLPDAITQKKPIYNYDNFVDVLMRELHDAWTLAREKLHVAKIKNKENYDKKTFDPELKIGDLVYLSNEVKKHKWDSPKLGPFEIKEIPTEQYIIIDIDGKPKKVHRNRTSKSKVGGQEIPSTEQKIINTICTFY